MKFIHISDLHIHTNKRDNTGVRDALGYIAENYPKHGLIVTGDITDDGAINQYENAYKLLKPFMGRLYLCPGNHDFGAAGNFYSRQRARRFDEYLATPLNQGGTFGGEQQPVVNVVKDGDSEVMLIALDSNLETDNPFDFACGEVGTEQLKALDTILASSARHSVKIVLLHHHPFMVNHPFMELKDAASLARTVYGRVDAMLFGHKHEMTQWENRWGIKHVLASDNSSDKDYAKEISIDGAKVSVATVPIR